MFSKSPNLAYSNDLWILFDPDLYEEEFELEDKLEKILRSRDFELVEFLENSRGVELSLRGKGKIFSLISEIKKSLKTSCQIKIGEPN